MTRIALLGVLFAGFACYSNNAAVKAKLNAHGNEYHPLYVGTSVNGDIVVAATHYDAMRGVAVTADEVGEKTKEGMTCDREMLTGTHVPSWICRFDRQVDNERQLTQDWLDRPRNCTAHCGAPGEHATQ